MTDDIDIIPPKRTVALGSGFELADILMPSDAKSVPQRVKQLDGQIDFLSAVISYRRAVALYEELPEILAHDKAKRRIERVAEIERLKQQNGLNEKRHAVELGNLGKKPPQPRRPKVKQAPPKKDADADEILEGLYLRRQHLEASGYSTEKLDRIIERLTNDAPSKD